MAKKDAPTMAAELAGKWKEKIDDARGAAFTVPIPRDFAEATRKELVELDHLQKTHRSMLANDMATIGALQARIDTLEKQLAALKGISAEMVGRK